MKYQLMIVEDEPIIRYGLVHDIEWHELGFHVEQEACNGKEALQLLVNNQPHAILTDIRMPIMDGLTLMTEVNRLYHQIKLVVISGYEDFEYARHALCCGAVGYIMKPTDDDEIKDTFGRLKEILDASISNHSDENQFENSTFIRLSDPVITQVLSYIEEHYQDKITLQSVAEFIHMNASYLSTYFKRLMGIGFKDYLVQIRMNKAKELLQKTNYKIYHIASMVGYDDCRHFNHVFKNTYGISASQARKKQAER